MLEDLFRDLAPEDQKIVEEELSILSEILSAIESEKKQRSQEEGSRRQRLLNLRDETHGAIKSDLSSLYEQIRNQSALANRGQRTVLPALESPYFARMQMQEDGKIKNILVGFSSFLSKETKFPIVDWRVAPIAKVFFKYKEGQEYEEELPGRVAEGTIKKRHILTIHNGKLLEIIGKEYHFKVDEHGHWIKLSSEKQTHFEGGQREALRSSNFGTGLGGKPSAQVSSLLDADQYEVITEDPFTPLLVLGGAGSGKTTIALHRLASLNAKQPDVFKAQSMVVIVPEIGIAKLSKLLLRSIFMGNVEVVTFDQWAAQHARQIIAALPKKTCQETPSKVVHFKRHPVILKVLDRYIEKLHDQLIDKIKDQFPDVDFADHWLQKSPQTALSHWLTQLEKRVLGHYERKQIDRSRKVQNVFKTLKRDLGNLNQKREELFSDHQVLAEAITASEGAISEEMVNEVISHTRNQFVEDEDPYAGIDVERKTAIDGHEVDWHTPEDLHGTIDNEDFTVLFHLLRRINGELRTHKGSLPHYRHLVLDEAQELAVVELAVVGESIAEPPSLTIAGDSAQHIDASATFQDWQNVLDHLGLVDVKSTQLKTNYRSTIPIAEFSHAVLGDLVKEMPTAKRPGAPVKVTSMPGFGQGIVLMVDELSDLIEKEPLCSVAIIARTPEAARRFFHGLDKLIDARLVENGNFFFDPGIDVTNVSEVKGLEFDYVVIPDADSHTYGEDEFSRRALHVACTRAIHQLWVISTSNPTAILPKQEKTSHS